MVAAVRASAITAEGTIGWVNTGGDNFGRDHLCRLCEVTSSRRQTTSYAWSLLALLVVGYIAYTRIPLTLFPGGFDYPRLFAWANYPNAGAVEVEQKVVHQLEEAVAQVSQVKRIRSNAYSGGGNVQVEFQKGTIRLATASGDQLYTYRGSCPDASHIW